MIWLIVISIVALVFYHLIDLQRYWAKKGVTQGWPIPLLGDNYGTYLGIENFAEMLQRIYNRGPTKARYVGAYQMTTPVLILRDPDLIKQVTVKDFDHFVDHRTFLSEDVDPLWANNLVALTGQRWRDMRATLSPSFTSSKMKLMFTLMVECAKNFTNYFEKMDKESLTFEFKDIFTRFANDVIASAAFGVQCDSLKHKDNEFYLMGKETTSFTGFWKSLKVFVLFMSPQLLQFLKLRLFSDKVANFFRSLIKETIKVREEKGVIRPDMIHLLLESRKGTHKKYEEHQETTDTGFASAKDIQDGKKENLPKRTLTDEDITAQAIIFFFAGFDSVSGLMSFACYELAVNQDIQKTLKTEIDEVQENTKGNVTYDELLKMKYLDMVISETLRKWPITMAVDRACTKPYTIEPTNSNENPLHLSVGDVIWLPVFNLHRDSRYYEKPDKFDPERFSDENKTKINPYAYIPFGAGPRNCIGSRFALLETKTLLFHLLSKFELHPSEKTKIPLKITRKQFNLTAEGGFWLNLKRRPINN